jgi:hypothetical protein
MFCRVMCCRRVSLRESRNRYWIRVTVLSTDTPSWIWMLQYNTKGYYKLSEWYQISVVQKWLKIRTRSDLKTTRNLIKISLATLIMIYQPSVTLRSLSRENGVLSAKSTVLVVISQDGIFIGSQIPGPHSMQLLPMGIREIPGISVSDATVTSRTAIANFTGHNQRRPDSVAAYVGIIRISRWRLRSNQWNT